MKGALAAAAVIPFSGVLAACAGSGSDTDNDSRRRHQERPNNPFGMADKSTVDAVIFDGGYGTDYVAFAASLMEKNHAGSTVKVSPTTKIAQELQPRFVGGNPPDLIDNSGADAIGFSTILDQLEDLGDVLDANNLEGTTIRDTLFGGVEEPGTFDGKLAALNYVLTVYARLVLREPVRGERLDPAEDVGRGDRRWAPRPRRRTSTCSCGARRRRPTTRPWRSGRRSRRAATRSGSRWRTWKRTAGRTPAVQGVFKGMGEIIKAGYMKPGGAGTQFTAAQAQWSNNQDALLYPSGSWIENEMKDRPSPTSR